LTAKRVSAAALWLERAGLVASLVAFGVSPDFYRSHQREFFWAVAAPASVFFAAWVADRGPRIAARVEAFMGEDDR
jgi:hypothetical protein